MNQESAHNSAGGAVHAPDIIDHLGAEWGSRHLRDDVHRAFSEKPYILPPKWFYDERGSLLFEQITRLPEYYPTEAERSVLRVHADEIIKAAGATTIVELGSGSSDKTRTLLDSAVRAGHLNNFVAVDVSHGALTEAIPALRARYPSLGIHGVAADFTVHMDQLPRQGHRLVLFLGGTIGNFYVDERRHFLHALAGELRDGEHLLLGVDLVKDAAIIEAAYNDSAGITAEFNLNVLHVINRELGANFDPGAWEHSAVFDRANCWMDIRLRSLRRQRVSIPGAGVDVDFTPGDEIQTEISTRFSADELSEELRTTGLQVVSAYVEPEHRFALFLAQRARQAKNR